MLVNLRYTLDCIILLVNQNLIWIDYVEITMIKLVTKLIFFLLLFSIGACGTRVSNRGNLPDPSLVAEISEGGLSNQEIAEILGSPSSVNLFGQETWYYISERVESIAFFEPEVKERQILIIKFGKDGAMQAIKHMDLNDGRQLAHVERKTPTFGQELTVIGQILGNFQRFNRKK